MVRLEGVVIPAEWDATGNVIGAALSAWDEIDYRVENDDMGLQLLKHLHEEVEISGEIKGEQNAKRVKVNDFMRRRRNQREWREGNQKKESKKNEKSNG